MTINIHLPHDNVKIPITEPVTLKDIIDFKNTRGIVGEEENFLILTMALLFKDQDHNALHVGIEGFAGSCKSFMVDNILNYKKYGTDILFPEEKILILSGSSSKGIIRNSDSFKNKSVLYITELQKVDQQSLRENIKDLSGNQNIEYMTDKDTFTIHKGISIVYCLAVNNPYEKDDETTRRFLKFVTDISQDTARRVVASKLLRAFWKEEAQTQSTQRLKEVQQHIKDCLDMRECALDFRAPFFSEQNVDFIPLASPEVKSYTPYFIDLMSASAIFHHKQRIQDDDKLFVNIQDMYNVLRIFGNQFVRELYGIPPYGDYTLKAFQYVDELEGTEARKLKSGSLVAFTEEEMSPGATSSDINRCLQEKMGYQLKHHIVRDILNKLVDLNFLHIDSTGKRSTYKRSGKMMEPIIIDFKKIYEQSCENMRMKYPDLAEEWITQNSKALYDPITGETLTSFPVVECHGVVDMSPTMMPSTTLDEPVVEEEVIEVE